MLDRIDQNLNTFTTHQFEELRSKVQTFGFTKAQVQAQSQFGFKHPRNLIKNLELSFVSEDTDHNEESAGTIEVR